jgi:L,D-peptidoglycan transpeptidase YkuD (ErfK/YbiS/YcfS/YnhG family)
MSSTARPGSAPRPTATPYSDGPSGSAYEGAYEGAAFIDAAYEGDAYVARAYGSYADGGNPEGPFADEAHADGAYADGTHVGGAHASGYGSGRRGGGRESRGEDAYAGGSSAVGGSGQGIASDQDVAGAPQPTRAQARAAARAQARRKRLKRTSFLGVGSVAAAAVIAVAGFMNPHHDTGSTSQADASAAPVAGRTGNGDASRSVERATPAAELRQLPGLGPAFLAKVPAGTQQVLLVTGKGKNQNTGTAVLYTRTAAGGWMPGLTWAARNAKDGWTTDHHAGDLHSPVGVFSLTDAGGLDPNPGTKLPYTHSSAFQAPGTGFEGESLADAFDYVIAINYNHVPGTSPLSEDRPMGASRGGGIWVHVDHGGPTHGCVALSKDDMRALLLALDPSKHPVIVMGDAASLAQ